MRGARPPDSARRLDLLRILPVLGVLLVMPPVLTLFDRPVTIFGVPLLVVYVFGVWLCGIVITGLVARLAAGFERRAGDPDAPGEETE